MKRTLFFQRPLPYAFYNATLILVGINVVIFLARYIAPNFNIKMIEALLLVPNQFMHLQHPWSVLTYMFVHVDELHIIFNMLTLVIFGITVEHKIGSNEFLLFYFTSGILSGILIAIIHPLIGWGDVPVVGASAAILAVMVAYATFFPYSKLLIWGIIPVKAYVLVILMTAFSIIAPLVGIMGNVAHLGHLGGIFFGFIYFPLRLRINPIKEIIYTRRYY